MVHETRRWELPSTKRLRDALTLPLGILVLLGVLIGPPALAAGYLDDVTGWGYSLTLLAGLAFWGFVGFRLLARTGEGDPEARLRRSPCRGCGRRPGPRAVSRWKGTSLQVECPWCSAVLVARVA